MTRTVLYERSCSKLEKRSVDGSHEFVDDLTGGSLTSSSAMPRRELREVDVVPETGLPGTLQQPKQSRTFRRSRSTTHKDDDAMMRAYRCEMQKVVPVAGQ